jgi:hypothetical protein
MWPVGSVFAAGLFLFSTRRLAWRVVVRFSFDSRHYHVIRHNWLGDVRRSLAIVHRKGDGAGALISSLWPYVHYNA